MSVSVHISLRSNPLA